MNSKRTTVNERIKYSKPIISSELTDVDFVEMTASSDEKKDADEDIATDVSEKLTFEKIVKILHTLKHAADDVFGADSNMVRVIKFKRDLEITADRKFSIK
ncbi:putative cytidylate kinase [Trichinella spiralis]|uniref:putative cytidylate kinase n=1 Tax=Trichinella spiralis TaxID=6334 RepID=UPI0001EFBC71|nr:putative cytidylate kinase [Trichinella spiralis]